MKDIIAITGTKGKTMVAYLIDSILRNSGRHTLRVDTTGHFIDGKRKSTLDESKENWALVPTICPGRFLWELKNDKKDTIPVFECSLGSSQLPGLGYKDHKVGVWTNVFEDHLGQTDRLKTREDIADAKDFVFSRINLFNGWAVFNADEPLIVDKLKLVKKETTKLLPCIINEPVFDIKKHLSKGGEAFAIEGTKIILKTKKGDKVFYDAKNLPWVFGGEYQPSLINLMFAIATVYAYGDGKADKNIQRAIDAIRMEKYGGRMTVLKAKSGALIIVDYAHEKVSLAEIGKLATKMAKKRGGKAVGVVRMAYDRTDKLIKETGRIVGKSFDELVVYEKIDGYWRKPKKVYGKFEQKVGYVSALFEKSIKETNKNAIRILREDLAYEEAAKKVGQNDVIVVIVNDNIERSVKWIKEKFKARFV